MQLDADFVVVGAGSAGCVLAARLTEDPATTVILLEAGGNDSDRWVHVPLGFGKTFADPSVNWCYETEPEAGSGNRRIFWPRGRVLGGSSSINGMIYTRGQAEDFDHWRQLGNVGWSFEDLLPYFERSERQVRGKIPLHGDAGPLWVSEVARNPVCDAFIESAVGCGHARNDDFNGPVQDGAGYHQATIRRGRRWSTADAYLHPAKHRPNLRVLTGALAAGVVLEGRQAAGVRFTRDGQSGVALARREVILCGGAVNSPQLLLLSGIGPAEHLSGLGLEVRHDLQGVGRNLQDHYSAPIKCRSRSASTLNDVIGSPRRKLAAALRYAVLRSGPLTYPAVSAALFARTQAGSASPDVKCSIAPFTATRPQEGLDAWSGFTLIAFPLRPESRGEVRLKTPSPSDAPAIHPNYLDAEQDQRIMVAGLRLCRRLLAQPPLAGFVEAEYLPGPGVATDDALLDFARRTGSTVFHPTSTCKMGADSLSVVDAELRVHGLDRLRVVDASIMPCVPAGNTNAPTIAIAEKAADLIRQSIGGRT